MNQAIFSNKKIYDSHTHSRCSDDGREPVEALCRAAIARGLTGIAVTDHCDIYLGRERCERVFHNLAAEIRAAREQFGDRLQISMGLEMGEAHSIPALAEDIAMREEIDFIIGSLHKMRGEEDFYFLDYDRLDLASMYDRYYDELIEIAELGFFDVMAHIGYQTRYMSERARRIARRLDHSAKQQELAGVLARKGKGMEVNSSTMRMGEAGIFPTHEMLRMFRAAGGEIVTTGSDAHASAKVGEGLPEAMDRLRQSGFEQAMFFGKRRAVAYPLA